MSEIEREFLITNRFRSFVNFPSDLNKLNEISLKDDRGLTDLRVGLLAIHEQYLIQMYTMFYLMCVL